VGGGRKQGEGLPPEGREKRGEGGEERAVGVYLCLAPLLGRNFTSASCHS
jgi:hypothetical protein